jgi:DNA-binding IclR family transcriptional regulator
MLNMIQVVKRAFRILDVLHAETALSLQELSRRTGIKKTTLHNIVSTLAGLAVVRNEGGGVYRLGPELKRLAGEALSPARLAEVAAPELDRFCQKSCETVILTMLVGLDLKVVAERRSMQAIVVRPETYREGSLYEWATGHVLLADAGAETVAALVEAHGLPDKSTWPEATGSNRLAMALEEIRRESYAERVDQEATTRSLAVPVTEVGKVQGTVPLDER